MSLCAVNLSATSLFFILLFIPRPVAQEYSEVFVVWNVGQGAAATLIIDEKCLHIDMGGETLPNGLIRTCRAKKNFLFITHYDWDHINLIGKARKTLANFCLMQKPEKKISSRKHRLLDAIPICVSSLMEVRQVGRSRFQVNNESNSYLVEKKILITGDAPQKQEIEIIKNLAAQKSQIQILLLGHHGSRTSTGKFLLKELPQLRLALASARKKRYGHPHREVIGRLKAAAVPWLGTEGYGHIVIELHH